MTDPYCVRTTKRPLSERGLGHMTKFRNFGTSLITLERIDICFKFGIDIDDGSLLRPDDKTTPKWTRLGSRDQNFEILGPPYNF